MAVEAASASWSCPALRPAPALRRAPLFADAPALRPPLPECLPHALLRRNTLLPEATQGAGWSTRSPPRRDGARRETQPLRRRRLQTEPAAQGPCPGEAVATPLWAPHCRNPQCRQAPPLWIAPFGVSPLQEPHYGCLPLGAPTAETSTKVSPRWWPPLRAPPPQADPGRWRWGSLPP